MEDTAWQLLGLLALVVAIAVGRQWYRRRVAAKLADKILAEVLKDKDAFRGRQ